MEKLVENLSLNESETKGKRKLASVQLIASLSEIKKVNKFDMAKVLGWNALVKKNEFKVGDKVVFFEIDGLLPWTAGWAQDFKRSEYKVTTFKISGQISQGIVLPLKKIFGEKVNEDAYPVGMDLTEQLGIKKYENDADEVSPGVKSTVNYSTLKYPEHLIEKSDELRLQSKLDFLDKFKGKKFYSSLKYDGTSSTYVIDPKDKTFYICSRNTVQDPNSKRNWYVEMNKKYKIYDKLLKHECRYAIQGEVYGPKIQKNNLQSDEVKIAIFCIKDIINNKYLGMQEMIDVCKELDLPMVEIIEKGDSFDYTLEQLLEKSKGKYPGTEQNREGLVYRLQENWNTVEGGRMSFKVINDDYLLTK